MGGGGDGEVSPLCIYPSEDWAMHCVKEICLIIGISCGGREQQTLALLRTINMKHWCPLILKARGS